MNNKLKIYARETKNGKEINHTQLVLVSSSIQKTADPLSKQLLHLINYKKKAEKKPEAAASYQMKPNANGSYAKQKLAALGSKQMNKSFDSNHISDITTVTQVKGQHKNRAPIRAHSISKEKVQESISLVIQLKERITELNNQIDLYEDEHNAIVSHGEKALSQLRNEKEKLTHELRTSGENPIYSNKEYIEVRQKQRSNDLLRKQIEEYELKIQGFRDEHKQLQGSLLENNSNAASSLKESYLQKIQSLDERIDSKKQKVNMHNANHTSDSKGLLSSFRYDHTEVSLLLKAIIAVRHIRYETLSNELLNEGKPFSVDIAAKRLLNLIDNNNDRNKGILVRFLEKVKNETQLKELCLALTNENESIIHHNRNDLNTRLNQLMLADRDSIEKAFFDQDGNKAGLVSLSDFKSIMTELNYANKIDERLNRYVIILMKENMKPNWSIEELAYGDLLKALNDGFNKEKSIIDEEVYLSRMKGYLMHNSLNGLDDLIDDVKSEIEVYDNREYIDNKVLNHLLREKSIIEVNEAIPCDKGDKVNLNDITDLKAKMSQLL